MAITQEKQLLLKDLCARLPYGIKGIHRKQVHIITNMDGNSLYPSIKVDGYDAWFPIETFKPYLRSTSSMTAKETIEWHETTLGQRWITLDNVERCIDWLLVHHFDFRGLIQMGLAIEAPKDMYKIE